MISVTILTKNSSKYLRQVLEALVDFDEVLLFDNGSTDSTFQIASEFSNVKVHRGKFEGFGPTHNRASSFAKNDWILSIDSDEVVSKEMAEAISRIELNPKCVYSFPRHNYFNDRWIRWCGWYPDRQVRLYHRGKTSFTDAQVHEAIVTDSMELVNIDAPIIHYSYESIEDFLTKMQSYSTLFAKQNCGKKKSSPFKAVSHGIFAFLKSYILKKGICGGYEGFVISSYNAHTAFYKYIKLYEANCRAEKEKPPLKE
jgi:glycosyltransferase involved in cell wall biosynthesis